MQNGGGSKVGNFGQLRLFLRQFRLRQRGLPTDPAFTPGLTWHVNDEHGSGGGSYTYSAPVLTLDGPQLSGSASVSGSGTQEDVFHYSASNGNYPASAGPEITHDDEDQITTEHGRRLAPATIRPSLTHELQRQRQVDGHVQWKQIVGPGGRRGEDAGHR